MILLLLMKNSLNNEKFICTADYTATLQWMKNWCLGVEKKSQTKKY